MSPHDLYVVALIPARSGSKGVKDKNLRALGHAPLIAWSIKCGLNSTAINRTIVSTDSNEYRKVARDWGAEVPFLRPDSISQDSSTDLDFVLHALDFFQGEARIPDLIVHLRPTTPLRNPLLVDEAISYAVNGPKEVTSIRSVHEMSETAYKSLEIGPKGNLVTVFTHSDALDTSNLPRQSFPKTYSPNGYVDVLKPEYILSMGALHGSNVKPFITETAFEIDTENDFELLNARLITNQEPQKNLFGDK